MIFARRSTGGDRRLDNIAEYIPSGTGAPRSLVEDVAMCRSLDIHGTYESGVVRAVGPVRSSTHASDGTPDRVGRRCSHRRPGGCAERRSAPPRPGLVSTGGRECEAGPTRVAPPWSFVHDRDRHRVDRAKGLMAVGC
jgi:hypothetical protein